MMGMMCLYSVKNGDWVGSSWGKRCNTNRVNCNWHIWINLWLYIYPLVQTCNDEPLTAKGVRRKLLGLTMCCVWEYALSSLPKQSSIRKGIRLCLVGRIMENVGWFKILLGPFLYFLPQLLSYYEVSY